MKLRNISNVAQKKLLADAFEYMQNNRSFRKLSNRKKEQAKREFFKRVKLQLFDLVPAVQVKNDSDNIPLVHFKNHITNQVNFFEKNDRNIKETATENVLQTQSEKFFPNPLNIKKSSTESLFQKQSEKIDQTSELNYLSNKNNVYDAAKSTNEVNTKCDSYLLIKNISIKLKNKDVKNTTTQNVSQANTEKNVQSSFHIKMLPTKDVLHAESEKIYQNSELRNENIASNITNKVNIENDDSCVSMEKVLTTSNNEDHKDVNIENVFQENSEKFFQNSVNITEPSYFERNYPSNKWNDLNAFKSTNEDNIEKADSFQSIKNISTKFNHKDITDATAGKIMQASSDYPSNEKNYHNSSKSKKDVDIEEGDLSVSMKNLSASTQTEEISEANVCNSLPNESDQDYKNPDIFMSQQNVFVNQESHPGLFDSTLENQNNKIQSINRSKDLNTVTYITRTAEKSINIRKITTPRLKIISNDCKGFVSMKISRETQKDQGTKIKVILPATLEKKSDFPLNIEIDMSKINLIGCVEHVFESQQEYEVSSVEKKNNLFTFQHKTDSHDKSERRHCESKLNKPVEGIRGFLETFNDTEDDCSSQHNVVSTTMDNDSISLLKNLPGTATDSIMECNSFDKNSNEQDIRNGQYSQEIASTTKNLQKVQSESTNEIGSVDNTSIQEEMVKSTHNEDNANAFENSFNSVYIAPQTKLKYNNRNSLNIKKKENLETTTIRRNSSEKRDQQIDNYLPDRDMPLLDNELTETTRKQNCEISTLNIATNPDSQTNLKNDSNSNLQNNSISKKRQKSIDNNYSETLNNHEDFDPILNQVDDSHLDFEEDEDDTLDLFCSPNIFDDVTSIDDDENPNQKKSALVKVADVSKFQKSFEENLLSEDHTHLDIFGIPRKSKIDKVNESNTHTKTNFKIPKLSSLTGNASKTSSDIFGANIYKRPVFPNWPNKRIKITHVPFNYNSQLPQSERNQNSDKNFDTNLNIAHIFEKPCFEMLKNNCQKGSNCKFRHILLDPSEIKNRILLLGDKYVLPSYHFIKKHYKLFHHYFITFCEMFTEKRLYSMILQMVKDCVIYSDCAYYIRIIVKFLMKFNMTKTDAIGVILKSFNGIRNLENIVIDLVSDDDVVFDHLHVLKHLLNSKNSSFQFHISNANKLATNYLRNPNKELCTIILDILLNVSNVYPNEIEEKSEDLILFLEMCRKGQP